MQISCRLTVEPHEDLAFEGAKGALLILLSASGTVLSAVMQRDTADEILLHILAILGFDSTGLSHPAVEP